MDDSFELSSDTIGDVESCDTSDNGDIIIDIEENESIDDITVNDNEMQENSELTDIDAIAVENTDKVDDITELVSESDDVLLDSELIDIDKDELIDEDKELFGFGKTYGGKYSYEKFDNSEFVDRLKNDFGIPNIEIKELRPDYHEDVYNTIKEAYERYPELIGQLRDINCTKLDNRVFACYGPTKFGEPFGGVLNLNSKYYSKDGLQNVLDKESMSGNFIPSATPGSLIDHEMTGHGAHLDLCAKSKGFIYGSNLIDGQRVEVISDYLNDVHVKDIVEAACLERGIEFGSTEFRNELSNYAAYNYGEAFAEAIAEQLNSDSPRELSNAIQRQYNEYRQRLDK